MELVAPLMVYPPSASTLSMYQVLLRLSQMRPISHTYSCRGVFFMDAQPTKNGRTTRKAELKRYVDPDDRGRGAIVTSFKDCQALVRESIRAPSADCRYKDIEEMVAMNTVI